MKLNIESTTKIVTLETTSGIMMARIWEGETESGVPVHCFITRLAPTIPKDDPRQAEFERELEETRAPSAAVLACPSRLIL